MAVSTWTKPLLLAKSIHVHCCGNTQCPGFLRRHSALHFFGFKQVLRKLSHRRQGPDLLTGKRCSIIKPQRSPVVSKVGYRQHSKCYHHYTIWSLCSILHRHSQGNQRKLSGIDKKWILISCRCFSSSPWKHAFSLRSSSGVTTLAMDLSWIFHIQIGINRSHLTLDISRQLESSNILNLHTSSIQHF